MVWVNFLTSLELPQKFPRSSAKPTDFTLHIVVDVLFAIAVHLRLAGFPSFEHKHIIIWERCRFLISIWSHFSSYLEIRGAE